MFVSPVATSELTSDGESFTAMPELPETETMARDLDREIAGRTIERVAVHRPDVLREVDAQELRRRTRRVTIVRAWRRAKLVVLDLSTVDRIVVQPRFTGALLLDRGALSESERRFSTVEFALGPSLTLHYRDIRRLGTVTLMSPDRWSDYEAALGIEPLDPSFTDSYLSALVRGSSQAVKKLLMDQRRVVGIGNIYANEALWRARIDPSRASRSLSDTETAALHDAIRSVLAEAVAVARHELPRLPRPHGRARRVCGAPRRVWTRGPAVHALRRAPRGDACCRWAVHACSASGVSNETQSDGGVRGARRHAPRRGAGGGRGSPRSLPYALRRWRSAVHRQVETRAHPPLSYFRCAYPEEKGARILREAHSIDWEYTPSEFAALLRELRLIKQLRPRFNVAMKRDDRHYAFIKLTRGAAPKLLVVRGAGPKSAAIYYGPFIGARRVDDAVRELSDVLGLRDCALDQPHVLRRPARAVSSSRRARPGAFALRGPKVPRPVRGGVHRGEYRMQVDLARAFLDGADDGPIARLRRRWTPAASGWTSSARPCCATSSSGWRRCASSSHACASQSRRCPSPTRCRDTTATIAST